jgi:hypothetical protein
VLRALAGAAAFRLMPELVEISVADVAAHSSFGYNNHKLTWLQ